MRAALARWPAPALAVWLVASVVQRAVLWWGLAPLWALAAGIGVALAGAACARGWWRRAVVAGGFPLAALLLPLAQQQHWPAWVWAVAGLLLLLLYPLGAWRDAPLFPTPAGALDGLARLAPVPPGASVLDAGCGAGAGLRALRRAYPDARLSGIERSALLVAWLRWRRPDDAVQRGDIWRASWAAHDLVYLFQRPESMPRAAAKARAEMRPGAWLVSLEFAVPGWRPSGVLQGQGRRPVWVYRLQGAAQPGGSHQDAPGRRARAKRPESDSHLP